MTERSTTDETATNRLIHEKSPYLLQHAQNPVDWYPWGEEAFARARREGKLILVSVGYSTCHWCHVMAHESFEDQEVATLLLEHYIAIKVDREERPDIDQLYMEVCTRLTGQGGWPLNVLLTPERLPFFAGTFIPKRSQGGRLGLLELLPRAAQLWCQEPGKLQEAGQSVLSQLKGDDGSSMGTGSFGTVLFEQATEQLRQSFDAKQGGFGDAPKFPRPHDLRFLLQRFRATGDGTLLAMVEKTLGAIACGGIWDHLGFGVHRYATDRNWLLPHFEKMLYDQAGLCLAALEAWQITGEQEYARVALETLAFVTRELLDSEGGFYCALDADSEGVEGKFYLWSFNEIRDLLGNEEAGTITRLYNLRPEGNFEPEVPGEGGRENILHLSVPLSHDERAQTKTSREKLFAHRCHRVPPHRDDKVLTAWNGFMISAFATAARVLDDADSLRAAQRAADFLWTKMRSQSGRLLRRYREGEAAIGAFSEDYAYFAQGLLDLYEADFDPRQLHRAMVLAADLVEYFMEQSSGRLFDTASDAEALEMRPRSTFDGAIPSPNALALGVFARLYRLSADPVWEQASQALMQSLSGQVSRYPAGFSALLHSAALVLEPGRELVITGEQDAPLTQELLRIAARHYCPETTVLLRTPETSAQLDEIAPFTREMRPHVAAAYLCQAGTCQLPLTSAQELARLLCQGIQGESS